MTYLSAAGKFFVLRCESGALVVATWGEVPEVGWLDEPWIDVVDWLTAANRRAAEREMARRKNDGRYEDNA